MSCAFYLANMLYKVTVFDKNPAPGGMLTLGIPSFRLEKDVVNAEIDVLREMGVEFKCGVEVGKDITLDELRAQGYKAASISPSALRSPHLLAFPARSLKACSAASTFCARSTSAANPAIGTKCAVIGGGNVAMDVCRTAVRLRCRGHLYNLPPQSGRNARRRRRDLPRRWLRASNSVSSAPLSR